MKKVLFIFLTLVYLVFSTGLKVNAHYCADKLQSIDFSISKVCNKCKKTATKGCCKDVSTILQYDDHSKRDSKTSFKSSLLVDVIGTDFNDIIFTKFFPCQIVNKISFFPLDIKGVPKPPLYILNCSFLI